MQDIVTADENGGTLPEEEADPNLDEEGQPVEEEDNASFRPQDLASFQAFVQRVNNQAQDENGETPQTIEEFTEEIYNAIRPWLVVKSTVFEVEASATSGKVTKTIRAVYRRTGSNAAAATPDPNADPNAQPAADPNADPAAAEDDGLPTEPAIQLTLLFRDISS